MDLPLTDFHLTDDLERKALEEGPSVIVKNLNTHVYMKFHFPFF